MNYKITTHRVKKLADLSTPVSIYLKVRDLFPESALLESSDFHTASNSYSYIGIDPMARFVVDNGVMSKQYPDGTIQTQKVSESAGIPSCFQEYLKQFQVDDPIGKNDINGFFGYSSFDATHYFESIPTHPKEAELSDVPDMLYIYYRFVIVMNHYNNELEIVENCLENQTSHIQEVVDLLADRNFATYSFYTKEGARSTISDETHKSMILEGIKHCKRGDVFQLVLSRRFIQPYGGDDFEVYRALRSINPSPYLFYFDFGSFRIFGSSPETHLRVQGDCAYIDPIAGTFKRSGDDTKDKLLAQELLVDPKENAEHVMLVDLARNDLSRQASEVKLDFYKEIHFYSHVIHMVSRVSGKIDAAVNRLSLFADSFPAGTLSGAPKIRAMQLIHELESHSRSVYGGCIGYVGINGDLNQAITIRTFLSKNNVLYLQAGGGIVAKSDPDSEVQEVKNKLQALHKAIELANSSNATAQ